MVSSEPTIRSFIPEQRGPGKRPRAVTFVTWLHVVEGIVLAIVGFIVLAATTGAVDGASLAIESPIEWLESVVFGIMAVLLAFTAWIVAFGLFRLRSWAWLMAMTAQGIALTLGLWARFSGAPEYVSLIMGVIVVLTLNQREVRQAFQRPRRRSA